MNESYESEIRRGFRAPMRASRARRPVFPIRPLPVGRPVVDLRPTWPIEPPEAAAGGYTPAQPTPPEGSEYARWVQSSLNELLGLRLPLDGIMGAETRRAIRDFQARRRLPADGIVGPDTQAALLAARRSLPPGTARELPPAGEVYEDSELEEELSRSSAEYRRWVQSALNQVLGLNLVMDGVIGRATRSAIRSFQRRQGLRADGKVGPATERALIAAGAPPPSGAPSTTPAVQPSPASGAFQPVPVETPGGGRITDKRAPAPGDVVTVTGVGGKRIQLHQLAAQAWQALVNAARGDGIADPLLLPVSGYRSPEHQARLWQEALERYGSAEEARRWVAPPGSSAHQSGRAIDFHLGGRNSSANVGTLRSLPAYRWLAANATRFGFYPYSAEPWHWEYNPPVAPQNELAPELFESLELPGEAFEATAWEDEVSRHSPEYIRWVQGSLNRIMGLRLAVDGDLGPKTRSAIRSFQQRQRLAVDGKVGPRTEAALLAAGATPPPVRPRPPAGAPRRPVARRPDARLRPN